MEKFLNKILDYYKSSPMQRSNKWFEDRKKTIGGSEVHFIAGGHEKNSKIRQFFNNKFEKNKKFIIPCQFGILFEEEIKNISQDYFKCSIFDIGNVKSHNLKYISFSPDGIGIINDEIVLFEFKCPYSRIPTQNIKNEYMQQIQQGLHILPFCRKCLYIEAVFKKCPLELLADPVIYYDLCSDQEKKYSSKQIANGIIVLCFYHKKANNKSKKIHDLFDYGKATKSETESLLYYIFSNQVMPLHRYTSIGDIPYELIGILPWKCFDYNVINVPRDNNYFNSTLRKKCLYYGHLLSSYLYLTDDEINTYINDGLSKMS